MSRPPSSPRVAVVRHLLRRDRAVEVEGGGTPSSWLRERGRPGDLVLTGSRDVASLLIQVGTGSQISHAAIIADADTVIEAYDYGLTPNEQDEGVFQTSFDELVARSPASTGY